MRPMWLKHPRLQPTLSSVCCTAIAPPGLAGPSASLPALGTKRAALRGRPPLRCSALHHSLFTGYTHYTTERWAALARAARLTPYPARLPPGSAGRPETAPHPRTIRGDTGYQPYCLAGDLSHSAVHGLVPIPSRPHLRRGADGPPRYSAGQVALGHPPSHFPVETPRTVECRREVA